ncbi:MAG: NAD(+) diphosphatase [Polyangiaceae bacterium]|jgi:NAD+ diphosphatase|nr:NAD(+) diphosphatase [Polyangiaceae bacterium]MBK8942586.1 NAD(+) diphosphatase [Polyangiaceae bacterium]
MRYFLDEPPAGFRATLDLPQGDPLVFAFHRDNLVVRTAPLGVPARSAAGDLRLTREAPLGTLDGRPCIVGVAATDHPLPEGLAAKSLRRLFGELDLPVLGVAAIAAQHAHFLLTHQRCGECGRPLEPKLGERCVRCSACERDVYPPVAPCVIVLVHDGPRILLTRQPRFPPGMYGLVAGFVEPGESLEACAHREILEEVGLEVTDLRYVASQPWPFPSQLMVGMTARYLRGELTVDTSELEDARWFEVGALPAMPPPFSIARHLIDLYVEAFEAGPTRD